MKKPKYMICALLLLAALLGLARAEEENLLVNGGFEDFADGQPLYWQQDMWLKDAASSRLAHDADGYEGSCATVRNINANDARYAQAVTVEPDTVYRLSGMILAVGCQGEEGGDGGANLSFGGVFVYTDLVYETRGGWKYEEVYGMTGPEQTSLTVFCRVGGYGSLATGSASFDDVSLVKVEQVPDSAFVYNLYRENTDSAPAASNDAEDAAPARYTESWILFICVYALAVLGVVRKRRRSAEPAVTREGSCITPRAPFLRDLGALSPSSSSVVREAAERRPCRRRWSRQTLETIRYSQTENFPSPRKLGRE